MNIRQAIHKIKTNLHLLDKDQLYSINSINSKTKINKVQYVNIYNIYRFINHKIMSKFNYFERAKEITKNNNANN